jgi:acetyl esterase
MGEADFPSRQENGEGYLLDNGMMRWFISRYLTGVEDKAVEPYCSPLVAEVADLPPAIIVVAEYDPLRDEGIEYAQRLKDEGVFVDLRREAGMIHGFFWLGGAIDRGRELIDELGGEIGKILRDLD